MNSRSHTGMKHSRQILSVTNAAVDALSSSRNVRKDKRAELRAELLQTTPSTPSNTKPASTVSSRHQDPRTNLNPGNPSSFADDGLVGNTSGDTKENSSSSLLELSFNGTQRVKVPSRLLREIKSPLEMSSSSTGSNEVPDISNIVDEQTRPTPVKVIRHVNGPSAWISSIEDGPNSTVKPPEPLNTHNEPSSDNQTSKIIQHRLEERNIAEKQLSEVMVRHHENDAHGAEDSYKGKQNVLVKGLYQGQPKSGAPVFGSGQENACDVKVKRFALNDKEKVLKEQFLKRKDQKKPTKKLVQPTLVSPQTDERKDLHEGVGRDNPVATAAAIAAAAASAATGPFLQLQHSLEAQIAALVANLQTLHQNHSRQQELQDKDKESELQQQMEERLKRLEELQEKMLQTQSIQSATVSNPSGMQHPSTANSVSAVMQLPTGHMTTATYTPEPEKAWQNDRAHTQYTVAEQHQPHHIPEKSHSYSGSKPGFVKQKIVRNTRTQTSPQESVSSEDSPLQTPLPRKRPPIPISRYDLPRTRGHRPHSDINRRGEKKACVHFEPDVSTVLPSYMREMTDKGRGLVRELASHNGFVTSGDQTRLETYKSSDSSVLPVSSEALSNEVGKIKTDLRDILTETERLKQELVKHQLLKDNVTSHSIMSQLRPVGLSPLDEYLEPTHTSGTVPGVPSTSTGLLPTNSIQHFADAERILRDVQHRRENLDRNLEAVIRQRQEQDLYNLVDTMAPQTGEFDEMLRIRREVDKKIGEITCAVEREIEQETSSSAKQKEETNLAKKQKSQTVKTALPGTRRVEQRLTTQPSNVEKKTLKKPTGKENLSEKVTAKKSKSTKIQAPTKRPASVTPVQKQVYLSSVYGRQPYHPQRTTSKAPYLHYQSPVNPKAAAIMAGLMAGDRGATNKPVLQDLTSLPEKEVTEPRKKKADAAKPSASAYVQPTTCADGTKYYFHPRDGLSQSQVAPVEGKIAVPLEGQLVPMAIPLGKPKTDPALRPPITTQQDAKHTSSQIEAKSESPFPDTSISSDVAETQTPVPSPVRPSKPAWPNVAVITMYDKELGESTAHQHKRHKKSPAKKKKSSLSVQVLPTVDIDSFSDTASSSPSLPHISDIPHPVSRPDDSEYQEFRNFVAVTETGPQEREEGQALDDDDDFHRIPTPQHPLTLEGFTGVEEQPYNGPPFPPMHPPVSVQHAGGVLEADTRQEEALQEIAMEWIEQELLARIVSEMNQPMPDPTTLSRPQATPESSTPVSEPEDEDADILAATIGLGGIQLFVDAGIPVDRDLVTNLIREVIAENVSTILGHPKPRARPLSSRQSALEEEQPSRTPSARGTPLATPTPTPDYTPPQSEVSAHESPVLATPVRTPTPSVTSEESAVSESREEEKALEPIRKEQDREEETCEQVSEAKTPVSTPVPTPPPVQSPPASISTPEPSMQEPDVSQDTPVPTPTPSIVVKTPTPEPGPEPELSITAEEPSQPKEPSVSQKELTPPKPAQPSVSSPSSLSSATLGTTTLTTEEEMSEGEMIQPYVHAGAYSEGEFAISPGIVRLAAERKLPLQGDWDSTILGQDQDSRNELMRNAMNGILQRGEDGKKHHHGNSSSSVSDSPYQASSASTLRDTEDIKEDSTADFSDREPGEIRPRDPMAVLLSRIQSYRRPADNSASDGEFDLRMPDPGQGNSGLKEPGEMIPGNLSPGEVVTWEPPGAVRVSPPPFPGELTLDDGPADVNKAKLITVVQEVAPRTADGEPSHNDRSLHASDLLPGTLGTENSYASSQQQHSKPRVIQVEERDSDLSEASLQNTYSVERRREEASTLDVDNEQKEKEVKASEQDRLDIEGERDDVFKLDEEEVDPQQPTKIQVTLPSVDNNNVHEESSIASDLHVSVDQDTFGDVSSISGGDF